MVDVTGFSFIALKEGFKDTKMMCLVPQSSASKPLLTFRLSYCITLPEIWRLFNAKYRSHLRWVGLAASHLNGRLVRRRLSVFRLLKSDR